MEGLNNDNDTKLKKEDTIIKVDLQDYGGKKKISCLEWCQLVATICIPIIIAIYTVVQDRQDFNKANMARASELQIAQDNRLNELLIAEDNRQKDRDLAMDQQWENILVEYHRFLSGLLVQKGSSLKEPERTLILLMSHTALNQLNAKRKRYVIRSLYEAKLIILNTNTEPGYPSFVEFGGIDLSNIMLGAVYDLHEAQPLSFYIDWNYLYLPRAIFRNASIRYAMLTCATLFNTKFDSADLSFAFIRESKCFNKEPDMYTELTGASFVNATLYHANFTKTSFYGSNFTLANMTKIQCYNCLFTEAVLVRADLTRCFMFRADYHTAPNDFHSTNLSYAVAHMAIFSAVSFHYSDWSHVQATEIRLRNCTFANATMTNASFVKGFIGQSSFEQTDLSHVDLSYALLTNATFVNATMQYTNLTYIKCEYCNFTNVDLRNSVLRNASWRYTSFVNCLISDNQLAEAVDLSGSKLPNGTIAPNRH